MRIARYSKQFRKDVKQMSKRGAKMNRLYLVMKMLELGQTLDPVLKEHRLLGQYHGYLECHIEPDWLLLYKIQGDDLYFVRTGSHSDLF